MRTLVIVCLSLAVAASNAAKESYRAHSSCSVTGDTDWVKAKPHELKSWLGSIVPVLKRKGDGKRAPSAILGTNGKDELVVYSVAGADGISWERFGDETLDGWVYGRFRGGNKGATDHVTGDNIAFIYYDMRTALLGRFEGKVMVDARATRITHTRCRMGIIELKFADPNSKSFARSSSYKFEQTTEDFLAEDITLMDPLDHRNVFIANSGLYGTGDGMFARRTIMPGEPVVIYHGLQVYDEKKLYRDNMTAEEKQDAHKNLMSYSDDFSLDIPPRYTSVRVYRASLGHKANHKFNGTNIDFDFLTSPRFGHIRCLRSTRVIERGEELFINYDYDVTDDIPEWYKSQYEAAFGKIVTKKEKKEKKKREKDLKILKKLLSGSLSNNFGNMF